MQIEHVHVDVAIVGAGLAGCATAKALVQADATGQRTVAIIDRFKTVHPRFSGEFIHPRGASILEQLGFYGPLKRAGAIDAEGFAVFEHADAHAIDLSYAAVPNARPLGLSVHHKTLVRTMRDVLRPIAAIAFFEGHKLIELLRDDDGRVSGVAVRDVMTKAVRHIHAGVVIGADGKASTVRKLAGISDAGKQTVGFTAGIELIDAPLPFPAYAHVMLGAWGPILAYPILRDEDGRIHTRVTFDLPDELPVKGKALARYIQQSYVPFMPFALGQSVREALLSGATEVEMAPTVNLPAPHAICRGLALVGDAAGCSHPITASGMTMCLRDAEVLAAQAAKRQHATRNEPWLTDACLRRYQTEHDRYVPTRQALADAVYEAFRGGRTGDRAIRKALFRYWSSGEQARSRSMALLSCSEGRPTVFLSEYLRTAGHAFQASLNPTYARQAPVGDRVRAMQGTARLARDKLGLVAQVMWAQVRPAWLPKEELRAGLRPVPQAPAAQQAP